MRKLFKPARADPWVRVDYWVSDGRNKHPVSARIILPIESDGIWRGIGNENQGSLASSGPKPRLPEVIAPGDLTAAAATRRLRLRLVGTWVAAANQSTPTVRAAVVPTLALPPVAAGGTHADGALVAPNARFVLMMMTC